MKPFTQKTSILLICCLVIFTGNFNLKAGAILLRLRDTLVKAKKQNSNIAAIQTAAANTCTTTATISGQSCVGSTLTVAANNQLSSVSWILDGVTTVATANAGISNNPVLVAGGNGIGAGANQLYSPDRLYVDKDGNIYIPEIGNSRVQKWAPGATSGVTVAGGNGIGSAANQFDRPVSVTVDAQGNIYVADQSNSRIQKWAPGAKTGVTIITNVYAPTGIFLDSQGNFYISEQAGQDVVKFLPGTNNPILVAGGHGYGAAANQLASPTGIFVDATGNLYICDADNRRVQMWAPGATSGITVVASSATISVINPLGVYVDKKGVIYVSDYMGGSLQKWIPGAGPGTIIADNTNSNIGQFSPVGIFMDNNNNLYVSNFSAGSVYKFPSAITQTYVTLTAGSYSANATSTDECTTTSNAIVVNAKKVPQVSITANTNIICPAFAPVFTASPINGGTNPLFQWKINNINSGNASATTTFSSSFLTNGNQVSCDLLSSEPCVTSALTSSNQITVTNVADETPTVSINANATTACLGSPLTFTATTVNCGLAPAYQWLINGNPAVNTFNNSSFTTSLLSDGDKVSCTVTSNAQKCQTSNTASSSSIAVVITPLVTPAVVITDNLTVIYKNSKVTFTALPVNQGSAPMYNWQINGITVASNTPAFTTTQLSDGDRVTCLLTSNVACAAISTATSNTIDIHITIVPPNTFTPNGDGINDTWKILGIADFPKCTVSIYNRYGAPVFQSLGYANEWAGYYKGNTCPAGVYYYIIKLDNKQTISGSITVIR